MQTRTARNSGVERGAGDSRFVAELEAACHPSSSAACPSRLTNAAWAETVSILLAFARIRFPATVALEPPVTEAFRVC
jgi:hypothetical protein